MKPRRCGRKGSDQLDHGKWDLLVFEVPSELNDQISGKRCYFSVRVCVWSQRGMIEFADAEEENGHSTVMKA